LRLIYGGEQVFGLQITLWEGATVSEYKALVSWSRDGAAFIDNRYSRKHRWTFDGGIEIAASSSPHVVPLPMSVTEAVDPEEAFVASLSSCHMLSFLYIAAKRGFLVEDYRDDAVGVLGKNTDGKRAMTKVLLRPLVRFGGASHPTTEALAAMHHEAHEQCFIANSVKTDVLCEPVETSP
jgi:organic hydroperoxide reductase OsmC/OhrA